MATGAKLVTYIQPNMYGRYFQCSKRTAGHLDSTKLALSKKAKRDGKVYKLIIIQGCYNSTVAASAGTHDKDSCLDVQIQGMEWADAQKFLRQQGWAAWWRKPPTFGNHIHMVSLPPFKLEFVAPVGTYVPGQVNDYYAKKDGLASHAADPTWHPKDIKATIFNYDDWLKIVELMDSVSKIEQQKADVRRRIQDLRDLLRKLTRQTSKLQSRIQGLS